MPLAAGRILLNGSDIGSAAPETRSVGWLPQEALLFPHLDGRQNILFGGPPARGNEAWWEALITAFEIEPLLGRQLPHLSGGEQQRLALARALWRQPRILLLDEPLAALGTAWRARVDALVRRARNGGAVVVETAHFVPPGLDGAVLVLDRGRTCSS